MEGNSNVFDLFITYAPEDKSFADQLAYFLIDAGLNLWRGKTDTGKGGDLELKINEGCAHTDAGIAILSRSFFAKNPKDTVAAALNKIRPGKTLIPVWHDIDHRDVEEMVQRLPKNQAPGHEEESLDKIIEDILKAVASEKRSGMAPVSIGQSTINNTRLVVMPLKPYNDWAVAVSEHPVTNKQYANFLKNVKSDLLDEIIHNHVSQKIHVDYLKSNFQKPCGKLMEEGRENDIFYPDTDERFNHRDNPVVCVSLIEALGYVSWLNSELNFTGYIFTLVSPALWRFAAFGRPGNNTYTVDTITQQHLVHKAAHPSPVSRKGERSNALGLSDMFGNVWEWCEPDVAERDDDETDGTAPGHKKTTAEIAGGGYLYDLEHISPFLSSEMLENEIFTRRSDLGFRIAALVNTKNMGPKEKEQLNAVEADATQYVEQYFNRNYKYY